MKTIHCENCTEAFEQDTENSLCELCPCCLEDSNKFDRLEELRWREIDRRIDAARGK